MTARRRSGGGFHGFVAFLRRLVEAFRHDPAGGGHRPGGKRAPRPQCPQCHRFVEELCADAEDGAEPCGLGRKCCCGGPHRAEKDSRNGRGDGEDAAAGQDGGKFKTSVQAAGE